MSCSGTITPLEDVDKLEGVQAKRTKMVRALKLIMYKERLGQLAAFNQERKKLRAGRSHCCFLPPDGRKIGKMEPALSETCTVKGQDETIATCSGAYSSWTKENSFTFRGVQCWNKTPERAGTVQPWRFPNLAEQETEEPDLTPELALLWPWCWIRRLKGTLPT